MKTLFSRPPHFIYEKFVKRQKEGVSFIIFLFFLITFIFSRTWVYLSIRGLVPPSLTRNIRGVHIHHFAWGILLDSLVGYLSLVLPKHYLESWKLKLASFFGIGLALTFDEFGMWLMLEDEYWVRQSYDAIIIIIVILFNIIYFGNLWKKLIFRIYRDIKKIG
ncbi:hypothetical protein HZB97_03520 [Candidatus Gottesmanbacteria bacterium]|nr:hypothetical protein [Candidatus Gottesmanbacteria bacterium]